MGPLGQAVSTRWPLRRIARADPAGPPAPKHSYRLRTTPRAARRSASSLLTQFSPSVDSKSATKAARSRVSTVISPSPGGSVAPFPQPAAQTGPANAVTVGGEARRRPVAGLLPGSDHRAAGTIRRTGVKGRLIPCCSVAPLNSPAMQASRLATTSSYSPSGPSLQATAGNRCARYWSPEPGWR